MTAPKVQGPRPEVQGPRPEAPCPSLPLVDDALRAGGWPHGVETDLLDHVEQCADCQALVTVTRALMAEWDATRREATVPQADVVWWKAQLRARQEAARLAALPVQVALGVALATVCGLLAAFGNEVLAWLAGRVSALGTSLVVDAVARETSRVASISPFTVGAILLAIVAAAVLAPVAVYVAGEGD